MKEKVIRHPIYPMWGTKTAGETLAKQEKGMNKELWDKFTEILLKDIKE